MDLRSFHSPLLAPHVNIIDLDPTWVPSWNPCRLMCANMLRASKKEGGHPNRMVVLCLVGITQKTVLKSRPPNKKLPRAPTVRGRWVETSPGSRLRGSVLREFDLLLVAWSTLEPRPWNLPQTRPIGPESGIGPESSGIGPSNLWRESDPENQRASSTKGQAKPECN